MKKANWILLPVILAELIGFSGVGGAIGSGLGKAVGAVLCIVFFILRFFGGEQLDPVSDDVGKSEPARGRRTEAARSLAEV